MHGVSFHLPTSVGLLLVAVFVLLNGFFVAAEFAIVKVRRTRIEVLVSKGNLRARLVNKIINKLDEYLSATQLGITLASIALGWVGEPVVANLLAPFLGPDSHSAAFTIAFIVIVVLHVVVGELIPKSIAIQKPEQVSLWIAYPLWIFDKVFFPFLSILNKTSLGILRLVGFKRSREKAPSEEELRLILLECSREGVVTSAELAIIRHALTFSDKKAFDILIPKEKVRVLEMNASYEVCYEQTAQSQHTRLPVLGSAATPVLGFVRIQDVLT
ncbi:MAG: hemolysin family protein, partial [Deltaproteobacteria bacterium]|nr:hemolysin family protein [Deltaproteobacteria bacterium]